MQNAMAHIRKTGIVSKPKEVVKKVEKKEVKKEAPVAAVKESPVAVKESPVEVIKTAPVKEEKKIQVKIEPVLPPVAEKPMTLQEKVLDFINKHPKGIKISAMEQPLGETRMKLGFIAKTLLDEGKVLKIENVYYPKPKLVK